MITHHAAVALDRVHTLAEGPVWDATGDRLLWVDIPAAEIMEARLTTAGIELANVVRLTDTVGAVVPAADGGLLVANEHQLVLLAPDGTPRVGPPLLDASVDHRWNDGAVDPAGRFLVGSMARDDRQGEEVLLRVEVDGTVAVVDDGITLSNGLAWSPDGTTLYQTDSVPGVIWARPYDVASGAIGPRTTHLRFDDGAPDGCCVDAHGYLWVAVWGTGQVRRYAPDGTPTAVVEVPDAPNTSSCAFVGQALDRLLITTATEGLAADADAPASGKLHLADVGVAGLPMPRWGGTTTEALRAR